MTLLTFNSKYVVQSGTAVTTSSTSLVDDTQASQTFTLDGTQTVLVIYVATSNYGASLSYYGAKNAISIDGTDYSLMSDDNGSQDYPVRNACVWCGTLAAGSHTIKGRRASVYGDVTTVSKRTLLIYIFNGTEFYYVDDTTSQASSSTTYVDDTYATTTITPSGNCKGLVLYATTNNYLATEAGAGKKICINIAGVDYSSAESAKSSGSSNWPNSEISVYVSDLSTASTTIKGRFATSNTGTVTISRRTLAVLLLDPSTVVDLVNSTTQVSTTSTSLVNDTQASISRNTSGELLVLGQANKKYGTSASGYGSTYGINVDTVDVSVSNSAPFGSSHAESNFVTYAATTEAGDHVINGRLSNHHAGETVKVDTRVLIALWFSAGGTEPTLIQCTSTVEGSGALTASPTVMTIQPISSSISGVGLLTATINELIALSSSLVGLGNLTASASLNEMLSSSVSGVGSYIANAQAGGPYASWSNKDTYTISSHPGNGYQGLLDITWKSGMNADFSDLRFSDGSDTILPYWIQYQTNSTSARVFVKLTASTTLNLHYGNASATSESSIDNTMEFGDEFSGSSLNATKWTGTVTSVTGGVANLTSEQEIYSSVSFGRGYEIIARYKGTIIGTDGLVSVGFGDSFGSSVVIASFQEAAAISITTNDGTQNSVYSSVNWDPAAYHNFRLYYAATSKLIVDSNSPVSNSSNVPNSSFPVYIQAVIGSCTAEVDYIAVRKFNGTEPTFSLGGVTTLDLSSVVAGSGVLTANAILYNRLSSSVSATGLLTANIIEYSRLSSSISSTGLLTANAILYNLLSSSVVGSGALTANAIELSMLSSSLVGSGTLTTNAALNKMINSTVAGLGSATANVIEYYYLISTISGTGAITANATVNTTSMYLSSNVVGTGALTANASLNEQITSTVVGSGSQTANLIRLEPINSTVSATGLLTAAASLNKMITSSLAGSGALTANISEFVLISSTVAGVGNSTANIIKIIPVNSSLVGSGSVTANPIEYEFLTSNISGTGTYTANCATGTPATIINLSSNIAGSGSATALANLLQLITSTCTGTGEATATPLTTIYLDSTVEATGQAQAIVELKQMISSAIAGEGSYTTNPALCEMLRSAVAGIGDSSAEITLIQIEVEDIEYPLTIAVYQNKYTVAVFQNKRTVTII